jgi:uncharacterized membrane protein YdcZ (DUF606 family)
VPQFGWFHLPPHPMTPARAAGGLLRVAGIALIARFSRRMRAGPAAIALAFD